MRSRLRSSSAFAVVLALAGASSESRASIIGREQVIALAQERAPEVLRALARVRQAEAALRFAEPLTREPLFLEVSGGPRFAASSIMADAEVSASLPVPRLLDRARALDATRAGVRSAESDARVAALSAVKLALDLYVSVLATKERLALAEQRRALAQQLLSTALARVEEGNASALERTLAEAELAASRAAVLAAEAELEDATGALAYLLGLPHLEARNIEGKLALQVRVPTLESLSVDEAVARALVERPDLARAARALERASAEADAAELDWLPSLSLTGSYALDGGEHVALFGIGVALPLFDLGAGARAEARAQQASEEQELELLRRATTSEVTRAYAAHRKALAAITLLDEEALPRAAAAEQLLAESYEAGKLDLAAVLVVRRDTRALRAEHIARLQEAALAANQLALAAGGEHLLTHGQEPP